MIAASALLLGQVAQQAPAKPRTLHEKIAVALGWTAEATRGFSLQALRDIVRPVSPALSQELTDRIDSGNCCKGALLPSNLHSPDCDCMACLPGSF